MNKIKIYLVDDEAIILRGLESTYPWEQMGALIVGAESNPLRAVEGIMETQPDIVITDIRMKQMTGLELIREVNRRSRKKFIWIVISAYRDFEYARKACEIGVFTYLLKPISDESLREAVSEASKIIRLGEKRKKTIENYEGFIESNKKTFESYMVGKFSGDEIDGEELQDALRQTEGRDWDALFYRAVCMDFVKPKSGGATRITKSEIWGFLEGDPDAPYRCFHFENQNGYGIVIFASRREENLALGVLERELRKLKQKYEIYFDYAISDLGKTVKGLKEVYIQAVERFELREDTKCNRAELAKIGSNAGKYIEQAIDYLQDHLGDEFLSVGAVAEEVHLNPVYFGRLFAQGMQCSFKQYLTEERIKFAKMLLRTTDATITEIGEKVGIPNPSYFTQLFKKHLGCIPTEYRKREYEKK